MCTKCHQVVEELQHLGFVTAAEGPRHGTVVLTRQEMEQLINYAFPGQIPVNERIENDRKLED